MKNLFTALCFILCIGFASAQQTTPSKNSAIKPTPSAEASTSAKITKPAAKKVDTKARPATAIKMKKDGTPDKRYKQNKHLKKDGTPDKRYN